MFVRNDGLVLQEWIDRWLLVGEICAQSIHAGKESIDLVLERGDLVGHVSKFIRVLEVGCAAVGSIDAL